MKNLYHTLLCCLLLSLVMGFNPGTVVAQNQEIGCVPKKRANRDKVWLFESYTILESEYKMDGYMIRLVPAGKQDSIYLYDIEKNKKLINTFLVAKDGRILEPVALEYLDDRRPYTDSIVPGRKGRSKWYFNNLLYTDALFLKVDQYNGAHWYYNIKGEDSLVTANYEDGLRLMIWYRDGKDSLERRWNAKGQLIYEASGEITQIWNDEQQLIEKEFDTLLQGNRIACIKSWHPSGALRSVKYYYFDEACLTWEYYDEKGRLVRLEKKKKLDEIIPVVYAVEPPPVKSHEVLSENVAELFKRELNRKLSEILCRTGIKPKGTYQVQVWLEASGKLRLNKLDGEYADVVGPEMETFFDELTGARPAQRNGRAYAQLLQLTLKVSDKGK